MKGLTDKCSRKNCWSLIPISFMADRLRVPLHDRPKNEIQPLGKAAAVPVNDPVQKQVRITESRIAVGLLRSLGDTADPERRSMNGSHHDFPGLLDRV